jgi:hypothetical protein
MMRSRRVEVDELPPPRPRVVGEHVDVVLADDGRDVLGEVGVVRAGADQLDGGRAPELAHAGLAPDPLALGVGLWA